MQQKLAFFFFLFFLNLILFYFLKKRAVKGGQGSWGVLRHRVPVELLMPPSTMCVQGGVAWHRASISQLVVIA